MLFLVLAVSNSGLGSNLGVVEHQLDVGSQGVTAGEFRNTGQQEGSGLLTLDTIGVALADGLLDGGTHGEVQQHSPYFQIALLASALF